KKEFPNTSILNEFEKPLAKTNASANPVILQPGSPLCECTTNRCEAYARGKPKQLCQGCWTTKYEERRAEILGNGSLWDTAVKEAGTQKTHTRPKENRKLNPLALLNFPEREKRSRSKFLIW